MAAALLIVSGASVKTKMPEGEPIQAPSSTAELTNLLVDLPVLQRKPRNPRHITKHFKEGFNDEND
jgi:hypothetical protein